MARVNGNALVGVSATSLWTLHNRVTEARRPDGVLRDPHAIEVFDAIDYDYRKFGKTNQAHGLRALAFDAVTRRYLTAHPNASVVALAEGLQTSLWRLHDAGVVNGITWYSVDLPPVIALRQQLLPRDERVIELAQSVLDGSWMDRINPTAGVFITAEGLLMYLDPEDALNLIAGCAARFPGGQMLFDSIPHWFSRRTLKGLRRSDRYVAPPMPFALNVDEAVALTETIPGIRSARNIALPSGRGMWKLVSSPTIDSIGPLRRCRFNLTLLEFET